MVAVPASLPYNSAQYRMCRILATRPSVDAWTTWLLELGSDGLLWFVPWYGVVCFMQNSLRLNHVQVLGLTHCTWYTAFRVLRQMGIDQTIPILDGPVFDNLISSKVTRAVLDAWVRGRHMVRHF